MSTRERIVAAIRRLVRSKAPNDLTFADVARQTGMHWTTIRRHVGTRTSLRALAANEQAKLGYENLDTRTRLLWAAARLIEKQGFQKTSLDEVAAEAGLTKGAIYWYFVGKHHLLLELMQDTIGQQLKQRPNEISTILAAENPVDVLAVWLANELPDVDSSTAAAMLFLECSVHTDPEIRAKLRTIVRNIVERIAESVAEAQAEGKIATLDPHVVTVYLQSVLNGLLIHWLIDPERVHPARWAPQLAQLILYGMQPQAGD